MSDDIKQKIKDILPLFYERKGFRELVWCPNLNEPCILTYRHIKGEKTKTVCSACTTDDHDYIMESHPFIGSVKKTYEDRTDVIDQLASLIAGAVQEARIDELKSLPVGLFDSTPYRDERLAQLKGTTNE